MKALTIRQPWVHAILHKGKNVENRSWRTRHCGWIAIHAGAEPDRDAEYPRGVTRPDFKELDYGAIVAIARVHDVRESVRSRWFKKPAPGAVSFGWILRDVRQLGQPIPCKGALMLWTVPPRIAAKIRRQFPNLEF